MGKVQPGIIRVETPVGVVEATLHAPSHLHLRQVQVLRGASDSERRSNPRVGEEIASASPRNDAYPNRVSVRNIPAYRHLTHIPVIVDGKTVHGDVAWGGNWFFLVHDHGLDVSMQNLEALTDFAWRIREQLTANGITGANGAEIDHVELFAETEEADSKSFVLCPGKAYDRSPCGTGTSAKLACLYADGKLKVGQTWKQQSVVGSIFEGSIQLDGDRIIPTITGEAWVMSEGTILVDERDPFKFGI
jgi:4-hydroxyproline epimerase